MPTENGPKEFKISNGTIRVLANSFDFHLICFTQSMRADVNLIDSFQTGFAFRRLKLSNQSDNL